LSYFQKVEHMGDYKKLFRSNRNKMIGGVCGGLGEYFSVDPAIIRLLCIFSVLLGGAGILLYLAAWLLIPPEQ